MTLCEKCIHEEVCDQSSRRMWSAMAGETECSDFKNKADFVEVVRCKGCKHYKPYTKPVEDFDGECIVRECETDENEFCSYGERRDS